MKLIAEGVATEAELTAVDEEIAKEVAAGVAFAEASPDPKAIGVKPLRLYRGITWQRKLFVKPL